MLQDLLGVFAPGLADTTSWVSSIVATALCVGAWGYFLYQGVTDPLGGVNTLWPLFGISNQMLAAVALTLCTVVIFKMKRERYAWVTIVPTAWLAVCTLTAGLQKVFHPDPSIGFLSHASRYSDALAQGQILAPAKDVGQMSQIVFNDRIDAALAVALRARRGQHPLLRHPRLPRGVPDRPLDGARDAGRQPARCPPQ